MMSDTEPDIKASILAAIEAYKKWGMSPQPLGPLVVPDWLPAVVVAEGKPVEWIDETARAYGFDGWQTVTEAYRDAE